MVEPVWTWSVCKQIPNSTEVGRAVIEEFLDELTKIGWDGRDYFHVQMAAEEAMVNAVTHGNRESSEKTIELEFNAAKSAAKLRFKDQGDGFCPDDLPDPRDDDHLECAHGRGVMLIKEMMDEVCYNESGNEVVMLKFRSQESVDPAPSENPSPA